ncbi:hypothetical protein GCM10010301_73500 [Streptomyces plicatus]|nr:hypothetical protein GCM10010301_73500 [Streptomyces plicatus]
MGFSIFFKGQKWIYKREQVVFQFQGGLNISASSSTQKERDHKFSDVNPK